MTIPQLPLPPQSQGGNPPKQPFQMNRSPHGQRVEPLPRQTPVAPRIPQSPQSPQLPQQPQVASRPRTGRASVKAPGVGQSPHPRVAPRVQSEEESHPVQAESWFSRVRKQWQKSQRQAAIQQPQAAQSQQGVPSQPRVQPRETVKPSRRAHGRPVARPSRSIPTQAPSGIPQSARSQQLGVPATDLNPLRAAHRRQITREQPVSPNQTHWPVSATPKPSLLKRLASGGEATRALILGLLIATTVILMAFFVRGVLHQSTLTTRLKFVQRGTLYQSLETAGLMIRSEVLEKTDTEGWVYPLQAEGVQVGYGSPITLVAQGEVKELRDHLDELKHLIAQRQLELIQSGQGERAQQLYEETDQNMLGLVQQLLTDTREGTLTTAHQISLKIQHLIDQRGLAVQKLEFEDPILKEQLKALKETENALAQEAKTHVSPAAGLVTYSTDGLEETLDYRHLEDLTADQLAAGFSAQGLTQETLGQRKEKEAVARIVEGLYQAIVVEIPTAEVERLGELKTLHLYFPDEQLEIRQAPVLYKLPYDHGVYLIVKTDEGVSQLLRRRRVNLQLRLQAQQGLLVPTSALIFNEQDDQVAQLATVRSGVMHLEAVKVNLRNKDQSIVEPLDEGSDLAVGSLVIQNPGTLKEGDRID